MDDNSTVRGIMKSSVISREFFGSKSLLIAVFLSVKLCWPFSGLIDWLTDC